MLFSFCYGDGTQCLVEVSQITYDSFDRCMTLHSFRSLHFECSEVRYNQICNDIYNCGKSDIRDLGFHENYL